MSDVSHIDPMFHSLRQFIVDMKVTFIASMALSALVIIVEYLFDI